MAGYPYFIILKTVCRAKGYDIPSRKAVLFKEENDPCRPFVELFKRAGGIILPIDQKDFIPVPVTREFDDTVR